MTMEMNQDQLLFNQEGALVEPLLFELVSQVWEIPTETCRQNENAPMVAFAYKQLHNLRRQSPLFAAVSLETTKQLFETLKGNLDNPRQELLQQTLKFCPGIDEFRLGTMLEFIVRIWLTVNIDSSPEVTRFQMDSRKIEWQSDFSLRDLIQSLPSLTGTSELSTKRSNIHIDPKFKASFLVDICRLEIHWTHNLAEHLNLDIQSRTLTIYEHKARLLSLQKDTIESPIPKETLREAIDTLNLLFPLGDDDTTKLIERENKVPLRQMGNCGRLQKLQTSDYNVWKPRLQELVKIFDKPPTSFWQLLLDTRNVKDWATFWVGILVLILTLVSIAFGTASTVYAVKQYDLAVAVACVEHGPELPRYCK